MNDLVLILKTKNKGDVKEMKMKQIISKSKDGNKMEIIAQGVFNLETLHIHKGLNNKWSYYWGLDEDERPILRSIELQE